MIVQAPAAAVAKIGDIRSAGLQRNVLTPDAKRWQLWGKGVRGAEAEVIVERLYGPQL